MTKTTRKRASRHGPALQAYPALTTSDRLGVVTVGGGRGFVMDAGGRIGRVVISAAHCLPALPPPHGASYTEERTYAKLLSPLGQARSVSAECLFVDPIADIAVLASPDNQAMSDEADVFEALIEATDPFRLGGLTTFPPG